MNQNMSRHLLSLGGGILSSAIIVNALFAASALICAATPASLLVFGIAAGAIVGTNLGVANKVVEWCIEKMDGHSSFPAVVAGLTIGSGAMVMPSIMHAYKDAKVSAISAAPSVTPRFNDACNDSTYDAKTNKLRVLRPAAALAP